ncbi:hypothetical protein [Micromonospora sp. NBC_01796]|uniref:hypothetical protein n=1 Tax=Micromonospora sp. NBC_01796 TaxID=2975987 RepID=UPI002DDB5892|nr:hypothetical protein [Micromonospora sp. NBC_01796]WSA85697.1 hypothetical protein OIE47_36030 [Micromonospora sp. NBC_01796]
MTEAVHTVVKTKAQIMAGVEEAISSSVLASVVVANPWNTLNQNNLVTQSGYTAWAPSLVGPGAQLKPLGAQIKLGLDPGLRDKTDAEIYAAMGKAYLRVGKERLLAAKKGVCLGTCVDICCLVVAHLGSMFRELFNPTSTIEVCFMATPGEASHALIVVDRAQGSALGDHSTWGPDAFVIDQWYALQRNSAPGSRAVKNVDPQGDFYDPGFIPFLTVSRLHKPVVLARKGIFTAQDFSS